MFFSICIPSYNRANTINRTLDSLVEQSFRDFEVLVVDDGSTDNTCEVVKKYDDFLNIKYFRKENGGKHTALNVGIDRAVGTFFIILDSDDWLMADALEKVYNYCQLINGKEDYCGVMCRCLNSSNMQLIGEPFEKEPFVSSYIDFHFGSGSKRRYIDCFEANKTAVLKHFRYPQLEGTRFVPESWLLDQIGMKYKLYCVNEPVEIKEYLVEGITNDSDHLRKNVIGYLCDYVSKIDDILPYITTSSKAKCMAWYKYWNAVKLDVNKEGDRVKKITAVGGVMYIATPILNFVRKILKAI